MNFRIRICKGVTFGPSGFRFRVGKHATIGRSGLLLFGRHGSMWLPRRQKAAWPWKEGKTPGMKLWDLVTADGKGAYDSKTNQILPLWYYKAKYKRNKPGSCAYQQIRPPRTDGKTNIFI